MRWQNSDEARAYLSTTRFHMQVAATSSHRSRRQSLARSGGGEITGSEQSARLARHHGREECPVSHTRRVNIATVALPAGGTSSALYKDLFGD